MKVLIVGGEGYIGSVLASRLNHKHQVTVYDILRLQDVRESGLIQSYCIGKDVVIYLASISNNDECEKNPAFAKSINEDAFPGVVSAARSGEVKRFIYASSVAAYGSSEIELKEDDTLQPTTAYGKGKAFCEDYLKTHPSKMPYTITRSASVCGWSPRMRNDLTINKMVHDALKTGVIKVNGGEQMRCHVAMLDICDFYALLLEAPLELVAGQAFNVVEKSEPVKETANTVAFIVGGVRVDFGPATDNRSYRVSGKKAEAILGFRPKRTYVDAIQDILIAHKADIHV